MNNLEENIINLYGEKGRQWLAQLPKLVTQMKTAHGLSDLKLVKNLSYNVVLSGFQGTQPIILKLGLDTNGFKREAAALNAFAEFGAVEVLEKSDGMLLLERAVSGVSLKSYFPEKEQAAIHIVCACLKRLHRAPLLKIKAFPHIKNWLKVLDQDLNIPEHTLHKARRLRDDLLATSAESVLLHGDLHHDNILKNKDDWIVIDPKGVIGEPAYECVAFIRNPIPELLASDNDNAANMICHRIRSFSEILQLPEQRILDWSFVQAVLAWTWALEDGCDVIYFKKLTKIFDEIMHDAEY